MANDEQVQCPYCDEHRKAATQALLAAGWKPPEGAGDEALVPHAAVHGFHRILHELKEHMKMSDAEIIRQMQADEAMRGERAEEQKLWQETRIGSPNDFLGRP